MPRGHERGFTLIELLVVIGIFVILTAIIVPIGQRLRENNNTSRCEVQLSHIGSALKAYYLDAGGVPPVGMPGAMVAGVPTPSVTTIDLDQWRGLQSLFYLGYLGSRNSLHCPRHTRKAVGGSLTDDLPEYFQSYTGRDPKAKLSGEPLLQYKYLPFRYQWAGQGSFPTEAYRQLTDNIIETPVGGVPHLVTSSSDRQPPDDTLVTWCNFHTDYYRLNGHGQYVGLFWDGSVQLLDEELFRDTTIAPAAAWQVRPTDSAH